MKLQDAEREFLSRYSIWSKDESEKGINESFPHLHLSETGNAGEKIKFVSKKKLQKIVTQKFKDAFTNKYVECSVDEGHWTAFDIKCGNWMIQTQFSFGNKPSYQQSRVVFWHNICSQKKAPHPAMPEIMYPVIFLCRCVSWPHSRQWEYLKEENVELVCDEIFEYCRRFFEAAPSLLKGLDVEGISENLP